MRRRRKDWGYRHPKTTAERRANQEGWERSKRHTNRLVNFWDDTPVLPRKSWKDDRKKQYRVGKRGQHHIIKLEDYEDVWKLKDYCRDHHIPFNIEEIKTSRLVPEYKRVKTGKIKRLYFKTGCYWDIEIKERIKTGKLIPSVYTDYYIFHWWYNKDIGLEYIIRP